MPNKIPPQTVNDLSVTPVTPPVGSIKKHSYFWGIFFVVTIALIWLLGEVMAPFVTGMAIAYLLNPLVTKLSRRLPRGLSCFIVLIGFAFVVVAFIIILSPMIGRQIAEFAAYLPEYIDKSYKAAAKLFNQVVHRLRPEDMAKVKEAAGNQVGTVLGGLQDVLGRLWSGGMAVIDIVTFLIITPVVAFYCMRDWPQITRKVDNLLPRQNAMQLRSIMAEFNMRLAGFVRGQLLVCLSLGTFYGLALTLVGLNFGLAIGLIAGLLSFIPYIGSIFGFVASVGVALIQYDDLQMPAVVVAIFFFGQFIEGNFLTPKLVGERIGLHAVWVIFALMAGGQLFGFTGMLLAVPMAALIGVIVRHALVWYQHSPAYLGSSPTTF